MKNNKGITMISLVITIVILLIIASISIGSGSRAITSSKLENLQTNMLLIEVKAKEYTGNANFDLGTSIDSVTDEEKSNRITKAKSELVGEEITDSSIFSGNINKTNEEISSDNSNYIYYYKLTSENLIELGLNKLKSDDKNGWYIVKYDIKKAEVEIYNTIGFKDQNTQYYSLSDIRKIKL